MMAQGTNWLTSVSLAFAQTRNAWKAASNPVASAPPLPATTYMPMTWPGWERWENEYGNGRQNGIDEQRIKLALTSSWVFADVNAVANEASLASLQVVERQREEQEDKEIVNHDLEVLWEQPNPFMGRSYLIKFWIFNLLLSGRAALFWVPGQGGLAECWPVPSLMLTPIAHPTEFITGYWFQATTQDKPIKIDKKYITWSRLVHPFDLRDGLSPLAAVFEAIEADLFMRRWNKAFFGKENAAPTGLITVPKDILSTDLARVRQEMAEFFGGAGNRRVAIAPAGELDWKPFDRSQKDMEFLSGREFSRNEIDRAFGFPEGYWSDTASRANAESAVARMIENAVWPHLVMLSEDMNAQTVPVWYGKQYRALFEDIRPRNRALEMQEMGVAQATLTIDEIRKKYWKLESIGDERGKLLVAEVGKGGGQPETPSEAEMPPAELPEAPEEPDDGMPPEGGEQPTDADQMAEEPNALDVKALDLDRWQTKALKALKAGKNPNVRFAPEALDDADADAIRAALMDARTPAEVRAVFAGFPAVKHGSHDQSTHGRRTARRRASLAAYRNARAGGASPTEARAIAKEAGLAKQAERDQRLARMRERKPSEEAPLRTVAEKVTRAYGVDPNQSYELQHRIVEMGDIQASNTANGGINPAYDPTLQPRDRSRAASQAQIDQVARTMNPDVLVTDFHRIDSGSPIIDADGNVLSGNGRTLAMQRAAELYPEQHAAYRARLRAEAEALGIDPAVVDRMQNPVLVRQIGPDVDKVAFAREANTSGTLRMSPLEQAKVDAQVLQDRSITRLSIKEGQDIDRALRDRDNKPFINEFLRDVPENERATLLTRDGELNQAGLYRIKAAMYTKAFPGQHGERMAESMLESLDPDVKTIQNGISAGLPSFSRAIALTRSGERDRHLDISDDFARVVDTYARIKDNPALTANTPAHLLVKKYLNQQTMFDRELTPQQERLLAHVDTISRKPTAVRDFLNSYARIIEDQPAPGQGSLFGDIGRMTKDELIDTLIRQTGGGGGMPPPQQQPTMWGQTA